MEKAISKAAALVEALGYVQRFRGRRVVVKMGGTLMDDPATERKILMDVAFMVTVGMQPIIVHGGGKEISKAVTDAGLETRFVQGRRYTDQRTLSIAEHVLCARINRRLVDALIEFGVSAMGLHSLSSCVLGGERIYLKGENDLRVDLGHVGKVVQVNGDLLKLLCNAGTVPVIAPIAIDKAGGKLNVNADEVAGEVAAGVLAEKMVCVSDTHGVRMDPKDPESLATALTEKQIHELIASGVISGGMLPKVESCLRAIDAGVGRTHVIDGRIDHALLLEIYTDRGVGTLITKE